jgi:hypothetical protein
MAEISITPADVLKTSTTSISEGVAGATITAGMAVYIDTAAAGVLKPCDADSVASTVCAGLALHGASTGQPLKYATGGDITLSSVMTVGRIYLVSQATAGSLCVDADILQGDFVSIVGVASTATNLKIAINNSGVARP